MCEIMEKNKRSDDTDTSKKFKMPKNTILAGLNFNANFTKKWMKSYLEIICDKKNVIPKIYRSEFALTGICEELCRYIIDKVIVQCEHDDLDLINVSVKDIINVIMADAELKPYYYSMFEKYDPLVQYGNQFFITTDILDKYISETFHKNIRSYRDGYNYIIFMLSSFCTSLLATTNIIRKVFKNSIIHGKMIVGAVEIYFGNGELSERLRNKGQNAFEAVQSKKNDEDELEPKEEKELVKSDNEPDEEEEEPKKKKEKELVKSDNELDEPKEEVKPEKKKKRKDKKKKEETDEDV